MNDDSNAGADQLIQELLGWAQRPDAPKVQQALRDAARTYHRSLLWRTTPIRLGDSIDLPPVAGEFIAR